MPQGGFNRDYQQITLLQNRAAEKQLRIEREKIGKEVVEAIQPQLAIEMKKIENEVIKKYESSLDVMSNTIQEKDKTLWFLIRVSFGCLTAASGLLGYLTAGLF